MLFGANKVMRGYKEYATGDDHLPPIGHVVFVTHGIGQNMDASSIEQSTRK
jgi:phospholipase DDHD1